MNVFVGAAHACIKLAVDHTAVRKQFRRRIIDNQAVQFKLANMAEDMVIARTMVKQTSLSLSLCVIGLFFK